jgi:hypothetical protein
MNILENGVELTMEDVTVEDVVLYLDPFLSITGYTTQ